MTSSKKNFQVFIAWQRCKTLSLDLAQVFRKTKHQLLTDRAQLLALELLNSTAGCVEATSVQEVQDKAVATTALSVQLRSTLALLVELSALSKADFIVFESMLVEIQEVTTEFAHKLKPKTKSKPAADTL